MSLLQRTSAEWQDKNKTELKMITILGFQRVAFNVSLLVYTFQNEEHLVVIVCVFLFMLSMFIAVD